MISTQTGKLKSVAENYGGVFIDVRQTSALAPFRRACATFRNAARRRKRTSPGAISRLEREARLGTHDDLIGRIYDESYSIDARAGGYSQATLAECENGLALLVDPAPSDRPSLRVADVGAGRNDLLRFIRSTWHVANENLYGVDLSKVSVDHIRGDGMNAEKGRLSEVELPKASFDAVFLSYFIDYDTDQRSTFEAALDLLKLGGSLVIEGKFPAVMYRPASVKETQITRGRDASEDIDRVCQALVLLGRSHGRPVSVVKIVRAWRYVRSHRGTKRLPSFFLVLKRTA